MAKKKVLDLNADATVQFEKKGQRVEGYFIGTKEVNGKHGPASLHIFQGETTTFGIFGAAQLDAKLGQVPAGALTTITYLGKAALKSGKTMKKYEVEYDDELSVDVSSVNLESSNEAEEEVEVDESDLQDVDDEVIETASDDDEELIEENPVQRPRTKMTAPLNKVSAEKRQRVQDLLSKAKR